MPTPLTLRQRRALVCVRGQCAEPALARRVLQQLELELTQRGMQLPDHPQHMTCAAVNCLNVCRAGPVLRFFPGAQTYTEVTETDIPGVLDAWLAGQDPGRRGD